MRLIAGTPSGLSVHIESNLATIVDDFLAQATPEEKLRLIRDERAHL